MYFLHYAKLIKVARILGISFTIVLKFIVWLTIKDTKTKKKIGRVTCYFLTKTLV